MKTVKQPATTPKADSVTTKKAAASKKATAAAPLPKKYNKSGYRFEVENVIEGDKIKFLLEADKWVIGKFMYAKASDRHPNGRCYISYQDKTYRRSLEHVEVMPKGGKKAVTA